LEFLEHCCSETSDCYDADVCTQDICQQESGLCQPEIIEECCYTDADCNAGGDCALGECTADHRCRYHPHPDGCDTQGPCGADNNCFYGYVRLEKGNGIGGNIVVNEGNNTPVMQLKISTHGVGGILNQLRFDWRGPKWLWSGAEVVASLYDDKDHDGKIDTESSTSISTQKVDLSSGKILFENINQTLEPATQKSYLVALTLNIRTASSAGMSGWTFPENQLVSLLAVFLALFVIMIGRTKYPKLVLRLSLMLILLVGLSCGRSGFDIFTDSHRVGLQIKSNDYVKIKCVPNEQVWIEGAPVDSDLFVVRKVDINVVD
jgi:hypothetical protein